MECKKCGSQINRDDLYCPVCGEKIEKVNDKRTEQEDFFSSYGKNRKELPKKDDFKMEDPFSKKEKVFAILGFVFAMVGLTFVVVPYVPLVFFVLSFIFCILGRNAYIVKGFAVAGAVISFFGFFICLLLSLFVWKSFFNDLKSVHKRDAERKAENVFNTAKVVLLEASNTSTLDGITISGSVYTTTVTDLILIGELRSTPFRGANQDGGMTISYDRLEKNYSVTCSGTIDGYFIEYDEGKFIATKEK